MASAAQIEIDALLEPIPGDEPAGNAVPFNVRRQLDEHRKEVLPEAFSADDPMRPEQPKMADWPAILDVTQETLKESSKDMLVAARLTEALTKEHGFGGLRDGLTLMRRLVEDCWDRIHPSIEDGDLEVRAAAFNWLDDADRGARFPHSVRGIGFIPGDDRKYSWKDWRDVMDSKGALSREQIEAGTNNLSREDVQTVVDDINESLAEIDKIVEVTTEKMADLAPGMSEVRTALRDCLQLADQVLQKKGPPPSAEPEGVGDLDALSEEAEGGEAPTEAGGETDVSADNGDAGAVSAKPRRANTRAEVYAQLESVSNRLLEIDPHSPISYLVQRAVKLSRLTLPQLLKALIRNDQALDDLNRDLDLGVEESAASGDNIGANNAEE
jgi:type VI secretion system protein ImpA